MDWIGSYQSGKSNVVDVLVHIDGCCGGPMLGVHDHLVHVDPLLVDHAADG